MKKKLPLIIGCLLLAAMSVRAENYLLNGVQESTIHYRMVQAVTTTAATRKLILSNVQPATYTSPTYNQRVEQFALTFSSPPDFQGTSRDVHGNNIVTAIWNKPPKNVTATLALSVKNSVALTTLKTTAPFPVTDVPEDIRPYLAATGLVPARDERIVEKARELTDASQTQFDAVRRILTWQIDHMQYIQPPGRYDALHALETGQGNCQNNAHLAAALMRAVGIPVRIVNGITLKEPYQIDQPSGTLIMRNAEGRHSWIEVYFPDLKWMPFDPQSTELFVSNRFIRIETGLDTRDADNDGLIRWNRVKGGEPGRPSYRENISADFVSDKVTLTARNAGYGPRNLLLSPMVTARFRKTVSDYQTLAPPRMSGYELQQLQFIRPVLFGNLDFPEGLDFSTTPTEVTEDGDGTMRMAKSFLVETAEYVTTRGKKYAQSFILEEPLQLQSIGLALHSFSREGQLWVELLKNEDDLPGEQVAASSLVPVSEIEYSPGYRWVDFSFPEEALPLAPGRYWIALGFTDGPIINWFFSFGKPTGLQDGTRFRTLFDEPWSHSLGFEFNYRVRGLAPENPSEITTASRGAAADR